MNRSLHASLLLFLAVAGGLLRAQPAPPSIFELARPSLDDDGPLSEPRHIGLGMTPEEVRSAMKGKADVALAPEVWVYWQFRSGIVGMEKFDTLVVTFGRGRVAQYRLVERKAMLALIEELRKAAAPRGAFAKK